MPYLSRLLLQQRLQEKWSDSERGSYALALRHPVPKELNCLPGLQLLPVSMLILISVLHWYGKRMALVRHPPPPPGGSSVDDLTPSATSRPRHSRARLGYPPGHTPIGIHHTFRSISTCHNSGPIITICRSSFTNTARPGSRVAAGPGSRSESRNGSRSMSGTGDRLSAGIGLPSLGTGP